MITIISNFSRLLYVIQGSLQGWGFGKIENFILGYLGLDKFRIFTWWLGIWFRGCKNVFKKYFLLYRFDHNMNVTQVIGIKCDEHVWQPSQKYN